MAIAPEPFLDFGGLMIGRVVMDEEHLLPAVSFRHAVQEHHVALAFEDLPMRVVESRPVEIDRAEDLLRIALTGGRD